MRSSTLKPVPHRNKLARRIILAVGSEFAWRRSARSRNPGRRTFCRPIARRLQIRSGLSWTLQKFPPQPYMNEIYWQFSKDTPAFFRDSLLQFVARTYYLRRDNFDGSKSQAWLRLFLHALCCVFALAPLVKQAS